MPNKMLLPAGQKLFVFTTKTTTVQEKPAELSRIIKQTTFPFWGGLVLKA